MASAALVTRKDKMMLETRERDEAATVHVLVDVCTVHFSPKVYKRDQPAVAAVLHLLETLENV